MSTQQLKDRKGKPFRRVDMARHISKTGIIDQKE